MSKKTTLREVSEKSGFSVSTISRVLNGSDYPVREDVRKKIRAVAQELNYVPPYLQKISKEIKSREIGVLIPTNTNLFYSQLMSGIEKVCDDYGYTPIFCSSRRQPDKEINNLKMICKKNIRGIILSSINDDMLFLTQLIDQNIPIVVFDQSLKDLNISYVKFDFFEAARLAVEYFFLKGHRKIAFASPPLNRLVRKEAFEGYLYGLKTFSIRENPSYFIISEDEIERDDSLYDFENGKYLASRILSLENRPTAVFTINDLTALGMIEMFNTKINVPNDISVIGCDNLDIASFSNPPLTTINQPAYEIGRLTAKILMDTISHKQKDKTSINLRPSIVERASVKAYY